MTAPRTDPPTPDPLRMPPKEALDNIGRAITAMFTAAGSGEAAHSRALDTALGAGRAAEYLAALPSAPDQRLRAALYHVEQAYEWHREGSHPTGQSAHLHNAVVILRALSEATTNPEATLDVDRLARAMHESDVVACDEWAAPVHGPDHPGHAFDAKVIAAEYARLRGPA